MAKLWAILKAQFFRFFPPKPKLELRESAHNQGPLGKVICIGSTEHAIVVLLDFGTPEVWIPKSQIKPSSGVRDCGDSGELIVSNWFATKKGWT